MKNPICVDLDGTLIKNDVTIDAAIIYIKDNPINIVRLFFWLLRGRAYLKKQLSNQVNFQRLTPKYNDKLIKCLKNKKEDGHSIFLATACDSDYANRIANDIGIFDNVFASDGKTNLRAKAKANLLVEKFGEGQIIYFGNSLDDVQVWQHSYKSILVNPSERALQKMKKEKHILFENIK